MIVLVCTFYFVSILKFKAFYLAWVCFLNFFLCGNFVIHPTIASKCFGQKNFFVIQSTALFLTVIFMFCLLFSYFIFLEGLHFFLMNNRLHFKFYSIFSLRHCAIRWAGFGILYFVQDLISLVNIN